MTKRALFIIPNSSDAAQVAYAYLHNVGDAACFSFDIGAAPVDAAILDAVREAKPEVVFYMGGESGPGLPSVETFRAIRAIAPSIHLGGDFADQPWRHRLDEYKREECFSLTVSIDGVDGDHVDYATLTPVDISVFEAQPKRERDIRCAFPGNHVDRARYDLVMEQHGTFDVRSRLLHEVGDTLTLRQRETTGSYADYVEFLAHCQIVLNTSWTGSGTSHHAKGRVVEAAFAGCAVLEMDESPTAIWFPFGALFHYSDAASARSVIENVAAERIRYSASLLLNYARSNYHPRIIYKNILSRL